MPLVVVAHGLGHLPEHALRAVIGQARDETMGLEWAAKHLPPFPDLGVILVAPSGYGNAGPWPIGEHDVVRVIEEMKRAYRIDADRISLTGYSLGGTVSFVVPLHYPDLFSAAAPLCGYPNLTTYQSVRLVSKRPWEEKLIAQRYVAGYADNGLHLPLRIVHGGLDGPGRSKVMADAYRKLGYAYDFDVQPELDHNVWDYAYEDGKMIAWLKRQERPAAPARVRWKSAEPRYDRAYWVRLLAARRSTDFAEIDAEVDRSEETLRVRTDNVAHFAFDRSAMGDLLESVGKLEIDEQTLTLPEGDGEVFASRGEDAWSISTTAPSLNGRKRPGVAGPLDDALRHPILIVVGTQDERQLSALRATALHHSSYDTWSGAHYPIRADVEVTPEEISTHTLVLVGGPAQNLVTRSLGADLPVHFDADGLTFRGKRYPGRDVGVSLIVVHPLNPDEYVVLHAGVGSEGALASRFLPRFAPDFLVYDRRITVQRGGMLLDRRDVLDAGFFDETWR